MASVAQPDLLSASGSDLSYYNTTRLRGKDLILAIERAHSQDEAIQKIFSTNNRPMTPSDVWTLCDAAQKRWPLTSIRRAINTLTKNKQLVRTDRQKQGAYGAPEHYWRLA